MPSWNSRGLRGSVLEEMVNATNEKYKSAGLALIQKVPTPITPVRVDEETRRITLAFFDQKSTVDYIGVVQGVPVCFDAKECASDAFPLQNVHEHQMAFMEAFEGQKGVAFLLLYFSGRDTFCYLPFASLLGYWNRARSGGRKSFLFDELDPAYRIPTRGGGVVHYLEALQRDLLSRDAKGKA